MTKEEVIERFRNSDQYQVLKNIKGFTDEEMRKLEEYEWEMWQRSREKC